jgi:hypothetical protein
MHSATVIVSANGVPADVLNEICNFHLQATLPIDLIVSSQIQLEGLKFPQICSNAGQPFSLARARNAGAQRARMEWLIFTDMDTCYEHNLFEKMVKDGRPALAGRTRRDVPNLASFGMASPFYACANSPLVIRRDLFTSVGGYCPRYSRWGYEDSDFEHKLDALPSFDSKARHILSIHNLIVRNADWRHGAETNRPLFEERMRLTREERIREDKLAYAQSSVDLLVGGLRQV